MSEAGTKDGAAPQVEVLAARAEEQDSGASAPSMLPDAILERTAAVEGAEPMLAPPSEAEIEVADEGVTAWHHGRKITALWSDHGNRNSWIAVAGMGWKKLSNANDSALVSMTMMAAHAEQVSANVNVLLEADGMVHQIYVW